MGMQVRLVLYARNAAAARRATTAAFAEIERLDGIFSDYRRDSEVTRLVQAAGSAVVLSNELTIVLDRALRLAEETGGAFDPTAGPLTALWRNAIQSGRLPTDELIVETAQQVGWNWVLFDSKRHVVELTRAGMRLDFGAIAKGFILDRALETLREQGIKSTMAEAGGDIVAASAPPGRDGWRIALPHPGACAIDIVDAAVSTSGDTEQFVEVDGVRYSHTVDPRTGYGLTNGRLVTVVATNGITADSLATTLTVLEPQAGMELLRGYADALALVSSARPGDDETEIWGERRPLIHCSVSNTSA